VRLSIGFSKKRRNIRRRTHNRSDGVGVANGRDTSIEDDHRPCCERPAPSLADGTHGRLSKIVHRMAHLFSQTDYRGSLLVNRSGSSLYRKQAQVTPLARLEFDPTTALQYFSSATGCSSTCSHLPAGASLLQGRPARLARHRHTVLQQRVRNEASWTARLHSTIPFHEIEVSSMAVGTFASLCVRLSGMEEQERRRMARKGFRRQSRALVAKPL
jgi:hypothetical protein